MKNQRINSINDVKVNDIVLLIGMNGKVKGMDRITELDYETGKYKYISHKEGKSYEGNLNKYLNQFFGFITDVEIFNYTEEIFDNCWMDLEWVFENMYGDKLGSFLRSNLYNMVRKDFSLRIEFIDLCKEYEREIYNIRWEGDEECGTLTEEETRASKDKFQKALNEASFFEFKI